MPRFIQRDYSRTESNDYKLHVQDELDKFTVATPVYVQIDDMAIEYCMVGWNIQSIFS